MPCCTLLEVFQHGSLLSNIFNNPFSFIISVIIDGHSYDGVGPSKKAARNEAAQNALVNAFCLEPPASLKAAFHPLPDAVDFGDYVSK